MSIYLFDMQPQISLAFAAGDFPTRWHQMEVLRAGCWHHSEGLHARGCTPKPGGSVWIPCMVNIEKAIENGHRNYRNSLKMVVFHSFLYVPEAIIHMETNMMSYA